MNRFFDLIDRPAVVVRRFPLARNQGTALGASQLRIEFRQRARMKTETQKAQHGLAVVADGDRLQLRRLVCAVESPVLFQFPNQKAKDPRDAGAERDRYRPGQGRLHSHFQGPGQVRNDKRQHQLVRHRDDRKVLDRIDLRLHEQIDAKADHVAHQEPDQPEDRFTYE